MRWVILGGFALSLVMFAFLAGVVLMMVVPVTVIVTPTPTPSAAQAYTPTPAPQAEAPKPVSPQAVQPTAPPKTAPPTPVAQSAPTPTVASTPGIYPTVAPPASSPASGPQPDAALVEALRNATAAAGFSVRAVQMNNSRPQGGDKVVFVSISEVTGLSLQELHIRLGRYWAPAISPQADLDGIIVIQVSATGANLSATAVRIGDIRAFGAGQLTPTQFADRWVRMEVR